jgi:nucleotide-binding universal stress UspA family protein
MYHQILVVARAADQGGKAAWVAGETARRMRTEKICLLVPYPAIPGFLGFQEAGKKSAARLALAETLAESLIRELGSVPSEVQTEFLEGNMADAAIAVSRVRNSDLIVMGQGATGFLGRIQDSILHHKVLRRTGCPVLIV